MGEAVVTIAKTIVTNAMKVGTAQAGIRSRIEIPGSSIFLVHLRGVNLMLSRVTLIMIISKPAPIL